MLKIFNVSNWNVYKKERKDSTSDRFRSRDCVTKSPMLYKSLKLRALKNENNDNLLVFEVKIRKHEIHVLIF